MQLLAHQKGQTFLGGGGQEEVAVWKEGGSKVFRTEEKRIHATPFGDLASSLSDAVQGRGKVFVS